jgi:DNA repair protein RadC
VIQFVPLATGTLDGAAVYPREVVKAALKHGAAAVIFCHYVAGHVMNLMCS